MQTLEHLLQNNLYRLSDPRCCRTNDHYTFLFCFALCTIITIFFSFLFSVKYRNKVHRFLNFGQHWTSPLYFLP